MMLMLDRARLEKLARQTAEFIVGKVGHKVGFCLIMFEFSPDPGVATYVCNADRANMIEHIEGMLDHLKKGLIAPPVADDGGEG